MKARCICNFNDFTAFKLTFFFINFKINSDSHLIIQSSSVWITLDSIQWWRTIFTFPFKKILPQELCKRIFLVCHLERFKKQEFNFFKLSWEQIQAHCPDSLTWNFTFSNFFNGSQKILQKIYFGNSNWIRKDRIHFFKAKSSRFSNSRRIMEFTHHFVSFKLKLSSSTGMVSISSSCCVFSTSLFQHFLHFSTVFYFLFFVYWIFSVMKSISMISSNEIGGSFGICFDSFSFPFIVRIKNGEQNEKKSDLFFNQSNINTLAPYKNSVMITWSINVSSSFLSLS